jgi:hypothetical protein
MFNDSPGSGIRRKCCCYTVLMIEGGCNADTYITTVQGQYQYIPCILHEIGISANTPTA